MTAAFPVSLYGRGRAAAPDATWPGETPTGDARRWVSRVEEALKDDLFALHYQPIVDLATGRTRNVEALVRMRGSDGALIGPEAFLPAAEASGLAPAIDLWVIDRVLADISSCASVDVFVNLSGSSIADDEFTEEAERQVVSSGIDPRRIVFEVTETASVGDIDHARDWMQRQKALGHRFALDDFGAGFSSFSYLRSLPADFLKIDGTFVRGLADELPDVAFVRAIVAMADTLGMRTVAECVESASLILKLRDLGVEMAQGFGLARPGPGLAAAASRRAARE